jgi:hypothetical protein
MHRAALALFATVLSVGFAGAAKAAEVPADVDLELVLAVDVSRSMDIEELGLQRDGYVAAFRHPEVVAAIQSGAMGRIAVTFVEWAGPGFQIVLVPWTVIANGADAGAFADKLDQAAVLRETGTSISAGLFFAAGQFDGSPARGVRRVVDVSGDGPNNMGLPVAPSRDEVISDGITINGLPIMLKPIYVFGGYNIPNLDVYYEDCVIGGPGAFVVTVRRKEDFEEAIRRKLVLEIAGLPARLIPAAAIAQSAPRVDCMIGEKSRGRWLDPKPSRTPGSQ